jgi:hypothetical protein
VAGLERGTGPGPFLARTHLALNRPKQGSAVFPRLRSDFDVLNVCRRRRSSRVCRPPPEPPLRAGIPGPSRGTAPPCAQVGTTGSLRRGPTQSCRFPCDIFQRPRRQVEVVWTASGATGRVLSLAVARRPRQRRVTREQVSPVSEIARSGLRSGGDMLTERAALRDERRRGKPLSILECGRCQRSGHRCSDLRRYPVCPSSVSESEPSSVGWGACDDRRRQRLRGRGCFSGRAGGAVVAECAVGFIRSTRFRWLRRRAVRRRRAALGDEAMATRHPTRRCEGLSQRVPSRITGACRKYPLTRALLDGVAPMTSCHAQRHLDPQSCQQCWPASHHPTESGDGAGTRSGYTERTRA